jgi:Alr-MurF fusion protein
MEYTIENIARATGGFIARNDLPGEFAVTNLSIDSRTLISGSGTLFFAIRGHRNNGHLYISELISKGVQAFIVSEPTTADKNAKVAFIQVSDTLEALQRLAEYHRNLFYWPVLGITGSNGKTIIKEWLYDLLSFHYSVVRSPKSYNSQVGVPLSVWNMRSENNLGIFEAGISKPGEMEQLWRCIRPEIGIFTNIGDAHQENFRSLEEKTSEKLRLFKSAEKLVFCADQDLTARIASAYCRRSEIAPVDWSLTGKEAYIAMEATTGNGITRIVARWKNRTATFDIPFTDASSVENACHCFAAIVALKAPVDVILPGFRKLAPLAMRLELKKGVNDCLLLNDYYNSDINSLGIALQVLNTQAEKNHLRKIVILSDIRQSGFSHGNLYRKVNQMLNESGIDTLIGIGHDLQKAAQYFTISFGMYESTAGFLSAMRPGEFRQSAILIKGAREFRFEEISSALQQKAHQTVFEVNLNTLVDNLNAFRSLLRPETKIMVMVKAFSYGTGDVEIAKIMQYQRVDYLAVAVADEGVELRNAGITTPIVVMNPEIHSFQHLIDYSLEPNIYSAELASDFAAAAGHNALTGFPVHFKIDTGMNRLGFKSHEELAGLANLLHKLPQIRVRSAFSHLVASDDPSFDEFTLRQMQRFEEMSSLLQKILGYRFDRHILNSAGIERFPEYQFEMVRLGIGLYGVSSTHLPLQPVGVLKSVISQVKTVDPGETVGYNMAGKVTRTSTIAVVPAGYADGLDRRLGNGNGSVWISGQRAPLVGNICMDMCMVDITGIDASPGSEVEFIGRQITIQEVAATMGTIPYEVLTGISQRVKRIYIQE